MVSIGFVLSHEQFEATDLLSYGVRAEQAGFDMIWTSDHFHPWMDNQGHSGQAWITLAALGQRLKSIPMGTGVTCPTYRYHPAIVAQSFASLGVLYPGRIFLGVGTGEAINEQAVTGEWGDYDERADRLIEAVELIRRLWTGQTIDHRSGYYRTVGAKLYSLPQQPVPIFIAAAGDQSMRLAGEYGDGLISDTETAIKPDMRREFEAGARARGKDPASMAILAESFVFVGTREQADRAAQMWRFIPKAWDTFVDNPDPRAILRQSNAEISLDEVKKSWVIGEDAKTHIEAIQKAVDGGVTHIFIHSGQSDQERVIDFYGREVLPQIRHERMQPSALTQAHEFAAPR